MFVCFAVSFVASVPMSDAVMNRLPQKKKMLSLAFLLGWITLGIMSALDVSKQLDDLNGTADKGCVWLLCMRGNKQTCRARRVGDGIVMGVSAAGWLTHDPGQLLVEQQHHLRQVLVEERAPTARRRRRSTPGKHGGEE